MQYYVNENCIGCGLCTSIATDVFTMADTGVAVAIECDVPKESEKEAKEAMQSCPVEAIEQATNT